MILHVLPKQSNPELRQTLTGADEEFEMVWRYGGSGYWAVLTVGMRLGIARYQDSIESSLF